MNPFASMNDGLLDVTWVSNPKVNNLTGVAGILGDAKKRGGVHTYKGLMAFRRGRKIRAVYQGR